jgi:hypothetical protein
MDWKSNPNPSKELLRDCRKTLNLAIWEFSLVCKLLIFNDAKITGTRRLDFFDSLSSRPHRKLKCL